MQNATLYGEALAKNFERNIWEAFTQFASYLDQVIQNKFSRGQGLNK